MRRVAQHIHKIYFMLRVHRSMLLTTQKCVKPFPLCSIRLTTTHSHSHSHSYQICIETDTCNVHADRCSRSKSFHFLTNLCGKRIDDCTRLYNEQRMHDDVVPISMCVFLLRFFVLHFFSSTFAFILFQHFTSTHYICICRAGAQNFVRHSAYYQLPTLRTNSFEHKWRKWCNSKIT